MADIFHTFTIDASSDEVFKGIATPGGLDNWWTMSSEGKPELGHRYVLYFGPQYNWKAVVTKCEANKEFELQITDAHSDWIATKSGFLLKDKGGGSTEVNFYHTGWPEKNEHFKISNYCWAMYLRILKRYIELGEKVPYESRLNV